MHKLNLLRDRRSLKNALLVEAMIKLSCFATISDVCTSRVW
jgi:hypothetical protein